jgi:hypothetical protein
MDEYIGLAGNSVRDILEHLRSKVKLTTQQKAKMRDQIQVEWDQTQDVAAYFLVLEQTKARLERWKIIVDEETIMHAAIKQIYQSNVFNKEHIQTWEDLEEEDQSWENLKNYFIEKFEEEENYAEATASKGGLQGMNNVEEEAAANEGEDEMAEYLYELRLAATENTETIQQVNTKTLGVVEELNRRIKTLSDTNASQQRTIEQLQKTIASQQGTIANLTGAKHQNPAVPPPTGGAPPKRRCKNCRAMVYHQDHNCPELPGNEHKRKAGWKSVFEGKKNPHY